MLTAAAAKSRRESFLRVFRQIHLNYFKHIWNYVYFWNDISTETQPIIRKKQNQYVGKFVFKIYRTVFKNTNNEHI